MSGNATHHSTIQAEKEILILHKNEPTLLFLITHTESNSEMTKRTQALVSARAINHIQAK